MRKIVRHSACAENIEGVVGRCASQYPSKVCLMTNCAAGAMRIGNRLDVAGVTAPSSLIGIYAVAEYINLTAAGIVAKRIVAVSCQ